MEEKDAAVLASTEAIFHAIGQYWRWELPADAARDKITQELRLLWEKSLLSLEAQQIRDRHVPPLETEAIEVL